MSPCLGIPFAALRGSQVIVPFVSNLSFVIVSSSGLQAGFIHSFYSFVPLVLFSSFFPRIDLGAPERSEGAGRPVAGVPAGINDKVMNSLRLHDTLFSYFVSRIENRIELRGWSN
ncbi:MAG: hypothetical protein WCR06_11430 [bacterium]